jgi:hypothetical protein
MEIVNEAYTIDFITENFKIGLIENPSIVNDFPVTKRKFLIIRSHAGSCLNVY